MRLLRNRVVSAILVVIVLVSAFAVNPVLAGWMHCRSDPVVVLSNGLILDLSADIDVALWKVEQVDYILHVPEGVNLVLSLATPSWLTTVETFTLYDDAPPGEYHSETIVHTSEGDAAVVAHTILLSALGLQLDAVSVPGVEVVPIHTYVYVP